MFSLFKIQKKKKRKKKHTHSPKAWQTYSSKIPIKQKKPALEHVINWESLYFIGAIAGK